MLTIYIPTLQEKVNCFMLCVYSSTRSMLFISVLLKKTRCVNQIEDVCKIIEKNIKQTIQNTLNSLEKDTDTIVAKINSTLRKDK